MSDFETTELKLRTTPTGGLAGEHSPYYRRLLSAGYKGYIQGVMGGAGYYGLLGLAVGALVALPSLLIPGVGAGVLFLIPAAAGAGIVKGASTFGNIGSTAAINAESADMAEQRRYLLDRYYELPNGPEGDKQAEIIKQELINQTHPHRAEHMFHWKTVAICAAIGAALALAFTIPATAGLLGGAGSFITKEIIEVAGVHAAPFALTAIGTGLGALIGATIGIDRRYVRGWFDATEKLFYDDSHQREALLARSQQVERLRNAAAVDEETKRILERRGNLRGYKSNNVDPGPGGYNSETPHTAPLAHLDQAFPDTKIHAAQLESRVQDIQETMRAAPV